MRNETIRWIVLLLIVLGASGALYYKYQQSRPCVEPIHYSIGAVDSRFDISKATLLSDTEAAVSIWNKAEGKTLLVYDEKAPLTVNLIYDEREASAKLGTQITIAQSNADTAHAQIDTLQTEYKAAQDAYNEKVQTINARGGATPSEAAMLADERASLEVLANQVNQKVAAYNANVKTLNSVIAEYNQTAGHTFEEGEYVRDKNGERINIFEFIGNTQLERVLAHEFGHAIGLDHNDNPNSIMYAKNESGNLVPTTDDLAALRAVCGS